MNFFFISPHNLKLLEEVHDIVARDTSANPNRREDAVIILSLLDEIKRLNALVEVYKKEVKK